MYVCRNDKAHNSEFQKQCFCKILELIQWLINVRKMSISNELYKIKIS